MKIEFTDVPCLPVGPYVGRFLGARDQDDGSGTQKRAIGRDGEPLPYGLIWEFQVVGGAYDGEKADRLTGKAATAKSACGVMVMTICGVTFGKGVTMDVADQVGTMWRFRMEPKEKSAGTRVSLIGLSRAYDLERPSPASMGGQHQAPPLDDDEAADQAPAEQEYWVLGPDKKAPAARATHTEVLMLIRSGKITPATRMCRVGEQKYGNARDLITDRAIWGPEE